MIKIIMADDHEIVRKGLVQIVSGTSEMQVAAEVGSARELLEELRRAQYDVVVLDIKMPDKAHQQSGQSGLDALIAIKRDYPKLPVLILSTHSEDEYALRVLAMGAAGYMNKHVAPQELIGAITRVYAGKKYVSPTLAEKLALSIGKETDRLPHEALSVREFQVMIMIAEGKPLKEIAYDLDLSEKTVSTYRTRVLQKFEMKKNIELARYAVKHGLIE